jgi:hypothetical protein
MDLVRLGSWPYITCDGFRSLANHVFDESFSFDPKDVVDDDVIFIRNNYLEEFFKYKLPLINHRFIIIANGDDQEITENFSEYLNNEHIIHFFASNSSFNHEKLTHIPLGVCSRRNSNRNNNNVVLLKRFFRNEKKSASVFSAFNLATKKDHRGMVFDILAKIDFVEQSKGRLSIDDYIKKTAEAMFSAAPRGNGLDCHRTWEALYLRAVPIVERMPMTEAFKREGLPVYLINDWNEISALTKEDLISIYNNFLPLFNSAALWMPYWQEKIFSYKKND